MVPKTQDQFIAELEGARRNLEQRGRDVGVIDRTMDDAGLKCDFELPYSSLTSITTKRWN